MTYIQTRQATISYRRIHSILRRQARTRGINMVVRVLIGIALVMAAINGALMFGGSDTQGYGYTAFALIVGSIILGIIAQKLNAREARLRLNLAIAAREFRSRD